MTDLSPAVVVVLVFYLVQDCRDDEQGQETTEKSNRVFDLRVPRKLQFQCLNNVNKQKLLLLKTFASGSSL